MEQGCEGAAVDCFYSFGLSQQPQSSKGCDRSQQCFSSFRPRCPGMMQKWEKPAPVLTSVLLPGVAQITTER